ncbi:hypothetical protein TSUD_318160 [Trifolium subterraneum]|uniref:DCD domain-containing protein n=1 Tax=Trifolium subterraneum TaxID=3900 RepID=A0A2Z6P386_TRISU|nr:hypothetical protein TSUD_318160 [Trifolium subterraneum]
MEANEVGTDTQDKLAGFIFMCNRMTKPECYRYRVFALPAGRRYIVERINPGTYLFLFDTDVKLLYGTYLATSTGMLNIQPYAFGGRFPAQVSFKIHQDCLPLPENHFKHAIKDNYQNHSNKFNPELNIGQVRNLLEMFRPLHPTSTAPRHPVLNGIHSASTLQLPPANSVFHQTSRASLSEDSSLPRMSPTQAISLLSHKYLNGVEEPTGWANSVAAQSVPSQASRNQIHALASIDTTEGTYATGTVSSYTPSLPYPQYAHQNFLNPQPEFHSSLINNGIGHAQSTQNYQHARLNVHPQPQFHASVMTAGSSHSHDQSLQYSQQAYLNVSHPPPEFHSSTMANNSYTQSLQDPQQSFLNPPPPCVYPPAANVDSSHAQMLWAPHGTHQNIQNLQPGYYPSAVNVGSSYATAQSFQDPQYTHQQAQNLQPGYGSSVNMDNTNAMMQSHASSSLYYPYVPQQVISGTYAVQGSAPIGSEYCQPSMRTE